MIFSKLCTMNADFYTYQMVNTPCLMYCFLFLGPMTSYLSPKTDTLLIFLETVSAILLYLA